jgi:hypothetical protein
MSQSKPLQSIQILRALGWSSTAEHAVWPLCSRVPLDCDRGGRSDLPAHREASYKELAAPSGYSRAEILPATNSVVAPVATR